MSESIHPPRRRLLRRTGIAIAGVVSAALVPSGPASAQEAPATPPPPVEIADFCANVPEESSFGDIGGSVFVEEIRCLAQTGITSGVAPMTFEPTGTVTRGQMATFVAGLIDTAGELQVGSVEELPASDEQAFTDVGAMDTHGSAINRLAAAGLVFGGPGGLPDDQFAPTQPVSRAQMASFLNRAIGFITGEQLTSDADFFTDVAGTVAENDIDAIASVGITVGVTPNMYEPARTVTRGQMAAFLVRTLSFLGEEGVIAPVPPAGMASFETALGSLNGSGATGTASVEVDGDMATVTVNIDGASEDLPHAQHIHIGGSNECPPMAADTDGDGFISTPEGLPFYGDIEVSLTVEGAVGPDSALAVSRMPVASDAGVITYERTFQLPAGVTAEDIANGVVVSHGVAETSLGDDDAVYDGPASPLSDAVPMEATLPQACGALASAAGAEMFDTNLGALNGSGATGTAAVEVNGNLATVTLDVTDTSPGLPHAQHIHIGGSNECPTAAADTDGDGFISTPEGIPAYGMIEVALTVEGDVSPASGLAVSRMPVASDAGVVTYERTFVLPEGVTATDIANGVIVHHGVAGTSLGTDDAVYDGPDSPLMAGVPQEATLPAACGALDAAA